MTCFLLCRYRLQQNSLFA
uniref:Uncharacterized protein n=1 Tax=Arundo donax TaxID=35708 RepID=A0A0A9HDJ3_ARUDO